MELEMESEIECQNYNCMSDRFHDKDLIQYTEDSLVADFHSLRQHWGCIATSHVDYRIHNTEAVYCETCALCLCT